jgi:hypothetical protein
LKAIEDAALVNMRQPVSQLRAEQLLATPWFSAARRMRLFDELVKERVKSGGDDGGGGTSTTTRTDSTRLVSMRRACLELEAKRIQIADPDAARRIATLAQSGGPSESESARS